MPIAVLRRWARRLANCSRISTDCGSDAQPGSLQMAKNFIFGINVSPRQHFYLNRRSTSFPLLPVIIALFPCLIIGSFLTAIILSWSEQKYSFFFLFAIGNWRVLRHEQIRSFFFTSVSRYNPKLFVARPKSESLVNGKMPFTIVWDYSRWTDAGPPKSEDVRSGAEHLIKW